MPVYSRYKDGFFAVELVASHALSVTEVLLCEAVNEVYLERDRARMRMRLL